VTMIAPIPALAPAAALASAAVLSQVTGETLPIRARKFVRLQGRGTNRRYEVTILSPGEGQDVRILKAVSAWLSHHLDQYTEEHASFAVPVTAAAALDGRFVAALGGVLTHRPLPEGMLGLLLPSAAWRHPGTAPLLAQCERLRCPVTLDDFSLRHDGFQILRSKAIRMVKLDPQLTSSAMNDRFARAALAAITQSARVLGFHCIAKGISHPRVRAGLQPPESTTRIRLRLPQQAPKHRRARRVRRWSRRPRSARLAGRQCRRLLLCSYTQARMRRTLGLVGPVRIVPCVSIHAERLDLGLAAINRQARDLKALEQLRCGIEHVATGVHSPFPYRVAALVMLNGARPVHWLGPAA